MSDTICIVKQNIIRQFIKWNKVITTEIVTETNLIGEN
jgi:hypothetical protein